MSKTVFSSEFINSFLTDAIANPCHHFFNNYKCNNEKCTHIHDYKLYNEIHDKDGIVSFWKMKNAQETNHKLIQHVILNSSPLVNTKTNPNYSVNKWNYMALLASQNYNRTQKIKHN